MSKADASLVDELTSAEMEFRTADEARRRLGNRRLAGRDAVRAYERNWRERMREARRVARGE